MTSELYSCPHTTRHPVETLERQVVAELCGDCGRELGPAWWCANCIWIEHGKIGYPGRERSLIRPCPDHAEWTG